MVYDFLRLLVYLAWTVVHDISAYVVVSVALFCEHIFDVVKQ
jgi:hypothetical protein